MALSLESRVLNFLDIQKRIHRLEFFGGGIELGAAHVGGRVNDLALQIGVIDDVEVNNAERADAGRAEIKRQRRAESARADAEHLRGFQLELPRHADFRHDQVARVAQDLVVIEA